MIKAWDWASSCKATLDFGHIGIISKRNIQFIFNSSNIAFCHLMEVITFTHGYQHQHFLSKFLERCENSKVQKLLDLIVG